MNVTGRRVLLGALLGALALAGCSKTPTKVETEELVLDGTAYRVSGPYAHENLAVYLIRAARQDQRDFLTLDEGLASGQV